MRRHVLVLGLPDDQARLTVADPHPDTPDKYKVPIERFDKAWKAGATGKGKPWAVVVDVRRRRDEVHREQG